LGAGAASLRPDGRSITGSGRAPQVRNHPYHRRMRTVLLAIGILLVLAGGVWIAQGLNLPFAPRSFMTSDRTWILIGAVTVVAGAVVVGWARSREVPGA
jgi:hypothetical protein